jgi:hypothetical protein
MLTQNTFNMDKKVVYQWDMQVFLQSTAAVIWMRDTVGPFNLTMYQETEPTLDDVTAQFVKPVQLANYRVAFVSDMQRSFKGRPVDNPIEAVEDAKGTPADLPSPVKTKK